MNKVKYVFIFIFLSFVFSAGVGAEEYECYYDYPTKHPLTGAAQTSTGRIIIDPENNIITEGKITAFNANVAVIFDRLLDPNYDQAKYVEKLNVGCQDEVFVCVGSAANWGNMQMILLDGTLQSKIKYKTMYKYKFDELSYYSDIYLDKPEDCGVAKLNEEKSSNVAIIDVKYKCEAFINYFAKMQENYCNSNSENCSSDKVGEYNKSKNLLKTYCNTKLQYGNTSDQCVLDCLDLTDKISELEGNKSDTGECGFSGRLMVWFSNILRWIKYLLPVAVILLAILDFIKAIGAEKDDEMKKAQGRFVKRLIAAALVFIIPLIIEFILDKMGFGYNDCGLF